ncbi:hypothetical protein AB5N19_06793 [Seiridium cardinale]
MAKLATLPRELSIKIGEYLDVPSSRNCRLTSTVGVRIATDHLFRRVALPGRIDDLRIKLDAFLTSSDIKFSLVRQVISLGPIPCSPLPYIGFTARYFPPRGRLDSSQRHQILEAVISVLQKLTSIRKISLHLPALCRGQVEEQRLSQRLRDLANTLPTETLIDLSIVSDCDLTPLFEVFEGSIERLCLNNARYFDLPTPPATVGAKLAKLKYLHFHSNDEEYCPEADDAELYANIISRCPALEELSFATEASCDPRMMNPIQRLGMQNLRRLSLFICWDPPRPPGSAGSPDYLIDVNICCFPNLEWFSLNIGSPHLYIVTFSGRHRSDGSRVMLIHRDERFNLHPGCWTSREWPHENFNYFPPVIDPAPFSPGSEPSTPHSTRSLSGDDSSGEGELNDKGNWKEFIVTDWDAHY